MTLIRSSSLGGTALLLFLACAGATAGVVNADCTPEKAAKGAAAKATVGVGGRCDPAEAAKDTAKRSAGIEDKGPIEKRTDKSGPAEKAKKAVK